MHDDEAAVVPGALADAEERAHAELLHRLDVEDLDLDAERGQRLRSASELGRKQHVGRLVDEIAREKHALGQARRAPSSPFARQRRRPTAIVTASDFASGSASLRRVL